MLQENVEAEEIDDVKWRKFQGRSIVWVKGCKNVSGMRFHVAFARAGVN